MVDESVEVVAAFVHEGVPWAQQGVEVHIEDLLHWGPWEVPHIQKDLHSLAAAAAFEVAASAEVAAFVEVAAASGSVAVSG